MTFLFWVTYGVLWLLMGIVIVLVMLLYRQFGLMIMPGSHRVSYGGLDVGARAPVITLRLNGRTDIAYDWTGTARDDLSLYATLAVFAMPGCPLCDGLASDESITLLEQSYPSVKFLWIDGTRDPVHKITAGWSIAGSHHGNAHQAMEVPGTPFAYLISSNRHVLAKGVVNDASDLDILLTGTVGPAENKFGVTSLATPASGSRYAEES